MEKFDEIIIGAGPAGLAMAYPLAAAKRKVAVVEADLWGGTCPNRGCDPKKVLLAAVEAQDQVRNLQKVGVLTQPAKIDWSKLMAFKKTFTDPVSTSSEKGLASSGITTLTGAAKFIDEQTIEVAGTTYQAEHYIIATGARPAIPNISGKEHFQDSTDFMALPEMPRVVTFVGGGYEAFEFAAMANAAGAETHVIQHNDRPLKVYDHELVDQLVEQLQAKGVQFHFNVSLQAIETAGDQLILNAPDFRLVTNAVFATTGRVPNVEALDLAAAGIEVAHGGIQCDDHLQTTNPRVFVAGDIIARQEPKETPVASFEGSYLVDYLTGKTQASIDYPAIPTTVYSSPKLAQVGVTTAKAQADSEHYAIKTIDTTNWLTYRRLNEPVAVVKIVTDKKTGLLVGATCLNSLADELINYFTLLINQKVSADTVAKSIYSYPTPASDLNYFY
ncbi:dihydrolipoyl dehydrogenase family protein [Loigolactobacillus iwatensis]|uniref:dihydrolipoyl dehydrogenase family protein n=1 Tax=Loigolactobacillus iwatensis TaxID=1267156 RepID=UPI000F7DB84A|nr:NAD(P)/FAD-dependent oxidoreductase [Loigolactobacillus iwatensis]